MHTQIKTLLATVALSALAVSAQAGPLHDAADPVYESNAATPRVDARQARQHARIAHGAARGDITPQERHRLMLQQRAIAQAEARAKADGVVTYHERRQLDGMQDHASRAIERQARDDDRRHGRQESHWDSRWDSNRWDGRHAAYSSRW